MAYTEAPETIQTFIKQRFRWMLGMLQTAFKHRDTYLHSGSMGVKLCTLPNIFIFQFIFALISPVMDLMLLWGIVCWVLFFQMHPGISTPPELWEFLGYWCGFQALELSAAALAFKLDAKKGWWWLLPFVVVQRFLRSATSLLGGDPVQRRRDQRKVRRLGETPANRKGVVEPFAATQLERRMVGTSLLDFAHTGSASAHIARVAEGVATGLGPNGKAMRLPAYLYGFYPACGRVDSIYQVVEASR